MLNLPRFEKFMKNLSNIEKKMFESSTLCETGNSHESEINVLKDCFKRLEVIPENNEVEHSENSEMGSEINRNKTQEELRTMELHSKSLKDRYYKEKLKFDDVNEYDFDIFLLSCMI